MHPLYHRLQIGLEFCISLAYRLKTRLRELVIVAAQTGKCKGEKCAFLLSCVDKVVDQGLKMKNRSTVLTSFSSYYFETFSTEAGWSQRDRWFVRLLGFEVLGLSGSPYSLKFKSKLKLFIVICTKEQWNTFLHFIYLRQDSTDSKSMFQIFRWNFIFIKVHS